MTHTVRDWMSSPVIVVPAEMPVRYALTLMRRRGIRSVVVDLSTPEKPLYGILTTTDIRDKIVGPGLDAGQVTVAEIMTSPVVCADPEWSLPDASRKMQEIGVHHLPVQDSRGSLIGMISSTDIFIAVEEGGWAEGL
jgi:CBS domain-containing membrane protein